ncbi:MAG: hypothetical protein JW801_12550 [Bacteroidales bacterium]|nr:hypothetical protein [Bacteroidales bacterium]
MLVRRKLSILLALSMLSMGVYAQYMDRNSAAMLALSGNDSRFIAGMFNANPAMDHCAGSWEICLNAVNRFGLQELTTSGVAVRYTMHGNGMVAGMRYFGSGLFHESQLYLSYYRTLGRRLQAGIRINYSGRNSPVLPHYEHYVSADLGMEIRIRRNLRLGYCLLNPNRAAYRDVNRQGDSYMNLSFAWVEPEHFAASAQMVLINYAQLEASAGCEYYVFRKLVFRTGLRTGQSFTYSFGMSVILGNYVLTAGYEEHLVLGGSAALMISFCPGRS